MTPHALLRCTVTHVRHGRVRHRLRYRIVTVMLDLGALDRGRLPRLFSRARFGLMGFRASDHGDGTAATPAALAAWARATLHQAGLAAPAGRLRLMCMPRVLGHAFNPISVFICDDTHGQPAAVLYQVNNTFGQRHIYACPLGGTAPFTHTADKMFHVSPFLPMTMRYAFRLSLSDSHMALRITGHDSTTNIPMIDATFTGRATPLTNAAIARAVCIMPLLGAKVVAAIHWEALKLWRHGAPFHRLPPAPPHACTPGSHAP